MLSVHSSRLPVCVSPHCKQFRGGSSAVKLLEGPAGASHSPPCGCLPSCWQLFYPQVRAMTTDRQYKWGNRERLFELAMCGCVLAASAPCSLAGLQLVASTIHRSL